MASTLAMTKIIAGDSLERAECFFTFELWKKQTVSWTIILTRHSYMIRDNLFDVFIFSAFLELSKVID